MSVSIIYLNKARSIKTLEGKLIDGNYEFSFEEDNFIIGIIKDGLRCVSTKFTNFEQYCCSLTPDSIEVDNVEFSVSGRQLVILEEDFFFLTNAEEIEASLINQKLDAAYRVAFGGSSVRVGLATGSQSAVTYYSYFELRDGTKRSRLNINGIRITNDMVGGYTSYSSNVIQKLNYQSKSGFRMTFPTINDNAGIRELTFQEKTGVVALLSDLEGLTGGTDGLDGIDGATGLDGTDGTDGTNGTNGLDGTDGVTPNLTDYVLKATFDALAETVNGTGETPIVENDTIYVGEPTSMTDAGVLGHWGVGQDYLYICIADNSWRRIQLSTF